MRFKILSTWDKKFQPIAKVTIPNKEAYCKKNNYLSAFIEDLEVKPYHSVWLKFEHAMSQISKQEWLFVTDIDSIFMNFETKLEEFIDEKHEMIVSYDYHGLNTSHFFIKNTDWGKKFINQVWKYSKSSEAKQKQLEQIAFISCILSRGENISKTKIVSQKLFNCYPYEYYETKFPEGQYEEGDFILHTPGIALEDREKLLKKFAV